MCAPSRSKLLSRPSLALLCLFSLALPFAVATDVSPTPPLAARLAEIREVNRFIPARALPMLLSIEAEARTAAPAAHAEFLAQLCDAYFRLGKHEQAKRACEELIDFGEAHADNDALAKGLLNKGFVEFALNDMKLSHKLVWESERLAANSSDVDLRLRSMIASGQSYSEEGNFTLALQRLLSASVLAGEHGDPVQVVMAQNALAELYRQLREYDKGFKALAEATSAAEQTRSPGRMATLRNTEANLALDSGQYQRALGALLAGLALERKIGADSMIASSMLDLSDCYLKLNDYRKAAFYARQALATARTLNSDILAAKARTYLAQAHPEVFERKREKEILEMQEQYEADKKQRLFDLLRRENEVKSAEIDNRKLQQHVWAAIVVAFALASATVGVMYRKVRFANAALREKNLELKQQSARDPLTDLYNRRHFQEFMRDRVPIERRGCGSSDDDIVGGLFLLDVDHFKQINDTHGHAAGDAVLQAIAARLRETLRETDMIVRWGGEEFLAYLPALPVNGLDEVARRLLADISRAPVQFQGATLMINASIGFAPIPLIPPGHPDSWERAINLVDMALYMAKRHGRNRAYGVRGFSQSEQVPLEQIEQDLERAWRAGHIDMSIVLGEQVAGTAA